MCKRIYTLWLHYVHYQNISPKKKRRKNQIPSSIMEQRKIGDDKKRIINTIIDLSFSALNLQAVVWYSLFSVNYSLPQDNKSSFRVLVIRGPFGNFHIISNSKVPIKFNGQHKDYVKRRDSWTTLKMFAWRCNQESDLQR